MTHRHDVHCWHNYVPCGEHHRHDYNCGGGELMPVCPDFIARRHRRIAMEANTIVNRLRGLWPNDKTFAREVLRRVADGLGDEG